MAQAADNPDEVKEEEVAIESNVSFRVCENVPSDLIKLTEALSAEAIADHECFRIAVSGGSFPKNFAAGISDDTNIDFSRWKVFFADERCVSLKSDDSNYKCFQTKFMEKAKGLKPEHVFSVKEELLSEAKSDDDEDPLDGVAESMRDQYLKDILKEFGVDPQDKEAIPSFDCIYLGMGPDGHTASLFPGHSLLDSGDLVEFIVDSPKPPPHRITLTLPLICNAQNIVFVVTGQSKQDAVSEITGIFKSNDQHSLQQLPSGLVTERAWGNVVWLLDKEASATAKL